MKNVFNNWSVQRSSVEFTANFQIIPIFLKSKKKNFYISIFIGLHVRVRVNGSKATDQSIIFETFLVKKKLGSFIKIKNIFYFIDLT